MLEGMLLVLLLYLPSSSKYLPVANVPDAETTFHAHEFLDATVPPKPIYISPNEIYSMHALIVQHLSEVVSLCEPSNISRDS